MTNFLIGVLVGALLGTTPFLIGNRVDRAKALVLLAKERLARGD
jgi:hypothetical protein